MGRACETMVVFSPEITKFSYRLLCCMVTLFQRRCEKIQQSMCRYVGTISHLSPSQDGQLAELPSSCSTIPDESRREARIAIAIPEAL
jgi:hypothetical protein